MEVYNPNEVHMTPTLCGICRKPFNRGEKICMEALYIRKEDLDAFIFFHVDCAREFYLRVPEKKQEKEVSE